MTFPCMLRTVALALLTPTLPGALAQINIAAHVMEMQDEMPPEKLPPSIRMSGIGNAHMEITATPEAQMWFDQGLNLLHDFWDYESARAFEQGVRVDPQCAMCYWDATEFIDHVSASNCSAGWTPPPVAPAGLNSKVQHAVQTWHVASSSTGLGVLVGSDTQTWYTDHATVQ